MGEHQRWKPNLRPGVALALLIGCGGTSSDPEPSSTWQAIAADESSALLAVWGTHREDVWVVGGRTSTGAPTILHYDGGAWTRVESQQTSLDLWWVLGIDDGDVLFSGSGGTILRHHAGSFQRLTTPTATGTIFGMWAASPTDIWAVGGGTAAGGVVWHSTDGQTFTEVPIPAPVPGRVFKVHGRAADDVWMSCAGGVTLHWDGTRLTREQTPTTQSLFSIITTPELTVSVGGIGGDGDLIEHDEGGWSSAALEAPVAWRGTAALGSDVVAVGENGLIAERRDGDWQVVPQQLTTLNFHSAWLDEDHGLWAVGGVFDGRLSNGLLVYHGAHTIPEVTR